MRRGAAGGRARAVALAIVAVLGVAAPAGAEAAGGRAATDPPAEVVLQGRAGRASAGHEEPGDVQGTTVPPVRVDVRPAAERASADPLGTLDAELAAADGAYAGFIVVLEEVGVLDHLRSLLTRGRPADTFERGAERVRAAGGTVDGALDGLVRAVVADLTVDEARALALDPAVRWISPDVVVTLGSRRLATDASHGNGNLVLWNLAVADTVAADWGQPSSAYYDPLDRSYIHSSDGDGVDVYIVDSGIDAANTDVAARVVPESEFTGGYYRIAGDGTEPDDDCNGHGTHVAGTVAGAASGVARSARLIPVKVFPDCERTTSYANIIDGLSWIGGVIGATPTRPAVVNMSLGGPASSTLDAAVEALIGTEASPRVTVVVAGGNENVNVSGVSPARVADAITVGALGNLVCSPSDCSGSIAFYYDERATYSNYGAGVDIMAPGSTTWSACAATNRLTAVVDGNGDVTGYTQKACTAVTIDGVSYQLTSLNGTSMAAPFVAGLAARHLGERYAADGSIATPSQVRSALVDGGLADVLTEAYVSLGGSPNLVANARFLEPSPSAPPIPVVVACTGGAAASELLQLPAEGVGPFTWSVTAGTLPDGLTLSAEGRITGSTTPATQIGTVTLQVEDPFGRTASATLSRSAFPAGCDG